MHIPTTQPPSHPLPPSLLLPDPPKIPPLPPKLPLLIRRKHLIKQTIEHRDPRLLRKRRNVFHETGVVA